MSEVSFNDAPSVVRAPVPPRRVMRHLRPVFPLHPPVAIHGDAYDVALPTSAPSVGAYRAVGKRVLDLVLVTLASPFALLLIGVCAVLLWIEGGTPFYRQPRLGKDGNRFSILKLRTMVRDADRLLETYLDANPEMRAEWETLQKLRHDPRITPIGAFLRKTSLDELPQLWNVLRGEMSLVGPRPMLIEQLTMYGNPEHYFALRPGITGYWQVSQRNESAFTARTALDAAYDDNMSLVEDTKVLLQTVGAVIRRTGC